MVVSLLCTAKNDVKALGLKSSWIKILLNVLGGVYTYGFIYSDDVGHYDSMDVWINHKVLYINMNILV